MPFMRQKNQNNPLRRRLASLKFDTAPGVLILLAIVLALAMLGGGSNQIGRIGTIPLRLASLVAIVLMVFWASAPRIRPTLVPLGVMCAAFVLIAAQLVPMPPDMWTALPGREHYADVAVIIGQADLWRPLSISPERTINALLAILPPLAALMIASRVTRSDQRVLVVSILSVACLSALMGFLQAGTGSSALALYGGSAGDATGLFANRNHQAVFLAACVPLAGAWAANAEAGERRKRLITACMIATLLVAAALLTRSRAGTAGALLAVALFAHFLKVLDWRVLLIGAVAVVSVAFGFGFADRLAERDLGDDARVRFAPVTLEIAQDNFPAGVGFGAFDPAFRLVEPEDELSFQYFNHAHNDIVELVIEGGAIAAILLVIALGWLATMTWRAWQDQGGAVSRSNTYSRAASFALLLAFLASFVDYPFRAPLFAVMMALFAALLAGAPRQSLSRDSD